MRKLTFPVRSLGSALPSDIDTSALTEWIRSRYGKETDLTTWNVETTLKDQLPFVEIPAAGGAFYSDRIVDAFNNVEDGIFIRDFDPKTHLLLEDAALANSIKKHCWWSIPSPSALKIEDAYIGDDEECRVSLSETLKSLCREMRDAGIAGHILTTEEPDDIELEYFSGKRYLWVVPDSYLETILEVQRDIVITKEGVSRLSDLMDTYEIRNICVRDADPESLSAVLNYFDPENINICGTAPEKDRVSYWANLSRVSVNKTD
ncbi:MAG: hypothetical protein M0P20_01305 [Methanocorpusculum sp.]|jgi:hypothetical protein|nr:hypothetical protein [Methanocorpusculum sp.]MDD3256738.1 hypothetical protein [Methanocorpusculum sp.]